MPDSANCCGARGAAFNSGNTFGAGPLAPPEPLDYSIVGDNLQITRVRLKSGKEVSEERDLETVTTALISFTVERGGAQR